MQSKTKNITPAISLIFLCAFRSGYIYKLISTLFLFLPFTQLIKSQFLLSLSMEEDRFTFFYILNAAPTLVFYTMHAQKSTTRLPQISSLAPCITPFLTFHSKKFGSKPSFMHCLICYLGYGRAMLFFFLKKKVVKIRGKG